MGKKINKNLNFLSFDEILIDNPNDINSILYSSSKEAEIISPNKRKEGPIFITTVDKLNQTAYIFSRYKDIKSEDIKLIDKKAAMGKAKAWYTTFLHPYGYKGQRNKNLDKYSNIEYVRGPLLYHRPNLKFGERIENVYGYDKNSAYLSILHEGFYPNLEIGDIGEGVVEENQAGYVIISTEKGRALELARVGEWADIRIPLQFSQKLVTFAQNKYKEMKKLKELGKIEEREEIKLGINAAIGILKSNNKNIWFYLWIVGSCRNRMEDLIDENTLNCSTDSIISIGPRRDLNIGGALGEFKTEYEDKIYYSRNGQDYTILEKETEEVIRSRERGRPTLDQGQIVAESSQIIDKSDYIYSENYRGGMVWQRK